MAGMARQNHCLYCNGVITAHIGMAHAGTREVKDKGVLGNAQRQFNRVETGLCGCVNKILF